MGAVGELLAVSVGVCVGGAVLMVAAWYMILGSKPREMLVKAIGEEAKQHGDDRIDPQAPIEPRDEKRLSEVIEEKAQEVDFDEALQRHSDSDLPPGSEPTPRDGELRPDRTRRKSTRQPVKRQPPVADERN